MTESTPNRSTASELSPPRRGPNINGLLVILVFMLAVWMASSQIWPWLFSGNVAPRPIDPRGDLTETEENTIRVFNSASPSVVFVTNAGLRRDWRTRQVLQVEQGSGSGIIWDDKGHIVTNYHVIEGADRLMVTLANYNSYEAAFIGGSREHDLAVLRIGASPNELPPIPIGESDNLQVGQTVFAIGNPFGFNQSLTRGIVSALNRDLQQRNGVILHDLIQTDAAINPGNSGGPLLDSAARLIGVNTAIYSPSQANAGIGFAIPVDDVNRIVPQLINHGQPVKPVLGVRLEEREFVWQNRPYQGVRLVRVYQNSPADAAGLLGDRVEQGYFIPGDMLLTIDQTPIASLEDFQQAIDKHDIGDTVTIRVLSSTLEGVDEREVTLTLAAGPDRN